MATMRMDRQTRKGYILKVMRDAHADGISEMTAGYIARKMGMQPSTHVRQMVFEMWQDGSVEGRVVDTGKGVTDGIMYFRVAGILKPLF